MSDSTRQDALGAVPQQHRQTQQDLKKELGFEIPVETVPLPSTGKIYPQNSPLYLQETLDISGMTAREEDILTSTALIKKGKVITRLIQSCLVDKSIDVDNMIAGDRNALMIAIRITGYGSDYRVDMTCPECDAKSKPEFNLANLPIKPLSIEPNALGMNLFDYRLPMTEKVVTFKYLNGHDESEINIINERKKKQGFNVESSITDKLLHSIVAIDGDDNKAKINQFIRYMPARDSLALRRHMDKNEPGVEMVAEFTCNACGNVEETGLPLGPSFFWPDTE